MTKQGCFTYQALVKRRIQENNIPEMDKHKSLTRSSGKNCSLFPFYTTQTAQNTKRKLMVDTQTHRHRDDLISIISFFQHKESKL
jgi:hypothetical protein